MGPLVCDGRPSQIRIVRRPRISRFRSLKEFDERHVSVTARSHLEETRTAPEVPPEPHGHDDGELLPIEGVDHHGSFATWRPRAADRGARRDAALDLEDDPGVAAPSVCFTAGQRVLIQCRIATLFRSLARVAGRGTVQSRAPKRRQTCPG